MEKILKEKLMKLEKEDLVLRHMKLIKEIEGICKEIESIDFDSDTEYNEYKSKDILFKLRIAIM